MSFVFFVIGVCLMFTPFWPLGMMSLVVSFLSVRS